MAAPCWPPAKIGRRFLIVISQTSKLIFTLNKHYRGASDPNGRKRSKGRNKEALAEEEKRTSWRKRSGKTQTFQATDAEEKQQQP